MKWKLLSVLAVVMLMLSGAAGMHTAYAGSSANPCKKCGDTTKGWSITGTMHGSSYYHCWYCKNCWKKDDVAGDVPCTRSHPYPCMAAECTQCEGFMLATQNHDFRLTKIINPTCTTDGKMTYRCPTCPTVEDVVLAALGHAVVAYPDVAPTCTTTGFEGGSYCSRCNTVLTPRTELPITHKPLYVIGFPATCTEPGCTTSSSCMLCGAVLIASEVIPQLGHIEVIDQVAVEPTCTSTGWTQGSHCSRCNLTLSVAQPRAMLAHDLETIPAIPAGVCLNPGWTEGSQCKVCQTIVNAPTMLPGGAHAFPSEPPEPAHPECLRLDYEFDSVCSVCGFTVRTRKTIMPTAEHVSAVDPGYPAACTTTGMTDGSHCSTCGTVLTARQEIPAAGHHYVPSVTLPGCETEGFTTHTCDACQDSYTDTATPPVGHLWREWTLNKIGTHTRTCLRDALHTQTKNFDVPSAAVTALESPGATSMRLSWSSGPGAQGYEVWYAKASSGPWLLARTTQERTYTRTYLTPGERCWFKVRAYKMEGTEKIRGAFSAAVSGAPLGRPSITSSYAAGTARVCLAWDAVPGATGYQILASGSALGTYVPVLSTSATACAPTGLLPKTAYFFKVVPYTRYNAMTCCGPASGHRAVRTPAALGR